MTIGFFSNTHTKSVARRADMGGWLGLLAVIIADVDARTSLATGLLPCAEGDEVHQAVQCGQQGHCDALLEVHRCLLAFVKPCHGVKVGVCFIVFIALFEGIGDAGNLSGEQ